MGEFQQNDVSKAVWNWMDEPEEEINSNIRPALIQFAVMMCIGALLYFKFHHEIMSYIVFALAWIVFISGVALPKVFNAIEKFGAFLGRAVGGLITWVLLVPFFFLCFVPGRLILMLKGIDPIERKYDKNKDSYFTPYTRHTQPEYYKNLF